MSTNQNLIRAKKVKDDEFYTPMEPIRTELQHYMGELKNKIILCLCDRPDSNFVKFFRKLEESNHIKKLLWSSSNFLLDQNLWNEADIIITNPPFSLFRDFF